MINFEHLKELKVILLKDYNMIRCLENNIMLLFPILIKTFMSTIYIS